jgi:Ca2+-binding RTX toxin-like protein
MTIPFTGLMNYNHIVGGEGRQVLHGTEGHDFIRGLGGNDDLLGRKGNDLLDGGAGADYINGGEGSDTAAYAQSTVGVSIALNTHTARFGDAEGDVLFNVENLIGSNHTDWLDGDNGANSLSGIGGDDRLYGHGGNDKLYGGEGEDKLYGGNGEDHIKGEEGSDWIRGDSGGDVLTGGLGDDVFSFISMWDSVEGTHDLIWDFSTADGDMIDLMYIDAKAHGGADDTFAFIGNAAFTAEGQVRYEHINGNTFIDVNISGEDGAEMHIALLGIQNLSGSDFFL